MIKYYPGLEPGLPDQSRFNRDQKNKPWDYFSHGRSKNKQRSFQETPLLSNDTLILLSSQGGKNGWR